MEKREQLFLGVDGGGTKTAAWLGVERDGQVQVLAKAVGEASNPRAVGLERAMDVVGRVVRRAQQQLSEHQDATFEAACLCLAGAGRTEEQHTISQWCKQAGIANRCRVVDDSQALFAARTGEANRAGIVLIAGTGSICWGRDDRGRDYRAGGWGYLLGDQGSGFALGSAAVSAILEGAVLEDGRRTSLPQANGEGLAELTRAILNHWSLQQIGEIVPVVYGHQDSRGLLASVAPLVFELVNVSETANRIVRDGAEHLARLVAIVARQMELEQLNSLAVAGGALVAQPIYRQLVQESLQHQGVTVGEMEIIEDPVVGALRLAVALAKSD